MALRRGQTGSAAIQAEITASGVLPTYTVATVPDAAENTRRLIHVSDGAAGSPCVALSNGTNWLRITLGAAVATS